jgi:hypothetical protein
MTVPTPNDEGVVFPEVDGRRSTAATGRAVLADAVRSVDPELADTALSERDWRRGYLPAYRRMTELAAARREDCLTVCRDGLAGVHARFRFRRDGVDRPLASALADGLEPGPAGPSLHSATLRGERPGGEPADGLSVPYRGRRLSGDDLDHRLDSWVAAGTAEPSFAEAVRTVARTPGWLDLRDLTVVVLGAGAEMGPVVSLLRWGAHVVAVDLPSPAVWARLAGVVRDSPGRLSVPVSRALEEDASVDEVVAAAGVDVVARTPELLAWLAGVEGPFTLGNYLYADGALHTRASVAVDAVTVALSGLRADFSLAFLATPTDAFCVPPDVVEHSRRDYERRTVLRRLSRLGSGGRLFEPNYARTLVREDGLVVGVNDSLVPQQGPNYALAKRIQRWRALHEREVTPGRVVSLNVAPATRTRSVMRNRALAAAYAGAHRYGVEVFDPSTSNTLMAALLVHDLRNPRAVASPAVRLSHPLELFWQGANHGGLWRTAFAPRSVLGLAVLAGMVQRA